MEGERKPANEPQPLWLMAAPVVFLLLWSGGYSAVKIGLTDIEPIFFQAVRYMVVLAILLPAWLVLRPPLPGSARAWRDLAVVGALIQGLYFGAANYAIALGASAAGLGIVLSFQPILVALLSPRFAGEESSRRVWIGLGLGLAGAAIAILAKSEIGGATASGLASGAVALAFIPAGTLYEKRFGAAHHPVVSNGVQCAVALALTLPAALALEECRITWSWAFVGATAYLAVANSIVAMTLLFAMIRRGAASRASALLFLVPPTSTSIAAVLLGEPMSAMVLAGMAVAGAGVWLVRRA